MADSSSPEPQVAAAPSDNPTDSDQAAGVTHGERATVVRRAPVPGCKPLPDAVAIGLVVVPDAAPPYDDARRGAPGGRPPEQAPSATRQRVAGSDAADVSQAIAAMADATRASAGRPGYGQFAGHWPSQFAQVLAETLAGSRPASQLGPWTTQQARRRINQLGPIMSTAHRPRVKRVIVTSPTGGVLEMTVIVGLGTRVHALAVRLERTETPTVGDTPGRFAPDRQLADHQGPQAAIRRGMSARPSPADHPGWICTAIEAA
jgi:Family of unknown function (DUF6459)